MTVIAKLMVGVGALAISAVAGASIHDRMQRRHFDVIDSNISGMRPQVETRATVVAKLGQPDVVAGPVNYPRSCSERYYYRPILRILDEEYLVCFDGSGNAIGAAYMVSQ